MTSTVARVDRMLEGVLPLHTFSLIRRIKVTLVSISITVIVDTSLKAILDKTPLELDASRRGIDDFTKPASLVIAPL